MRGTRYSTDNGRRESRAMIDGKRVKKSEVEERSTVR
jgi:hypothetical protein